VNVPFNGWAQGVWYYLPVILIGIGLMTGLWRWGYWWAGIPVLLLGLGMMLFFRDFPREIAAAPEEIVSPADGAVVAIEDLEETPHYDGRCRRVSIFMSVFSVHVNRAPFDGVVRKVLYAPGEYKNAMDPESSRVNESNAVWLETDRGPITVRQISGAVARHIVCPLAPGMRLEKGEKFGMIKFGSRVELYLPPGTEICVELKDKVYGGTTIMARFDSGDKAEA
jgi:phosphatidylserine decarboxylase